MRVKLATAGTAAARALQPMGGALRGRDFRWWFGGQLTSASGAMTQSVALSWLVLQQTGNAEWLSALTACSWGPTLLLGPLAGALVDRSDRRTLLQVTQSLLLVIGLTLSALAASGTLQLWQILVLAALSGTVSTVDSPARQVYVVDLVGREALASAVGLWEVALNASRVLGPGLGGALLATSGPAACFAVNALGYCAPILVLRRLAPAQPVPRASTGKRSGQTRAGLAYARHSPLFRTLLPMSAASGLIFSMGITLPTLSSRALHLGGGGYGALMAAFGLGGLPGALLAAGSPVPTARRVRRLALATAVSVLAVAWAPATPLTFAAMASTGLTSIWFIASANTLAQLRCDPLMRGRVMALWGTAMTGTLPLTGLVATALAQHLGSRFGFSLSGVALGTVTLLGWRALADHQRVPAHPSPPDSEIRPHD